MYCNRCRDVRESPSGFCRECGARLTEQPLPLEPRPYAAAVQPPAPLVGIVWALALCPLIPLLGELVLGGLPISSQVYHPVLVTTAIILNGVFACADARSLWRRGVRVGWNPLVALLVPAYLVARSVRLRKGFVLPVVWLAAFVVALHSASVLADTVGVRLNGSKVERWVTASDSLAAVGLGLTDVSCPAYPRVRPGGSFDCTATRSGDPWLVHVKLLDETGQISWSTQRTSPRA